jgi:uncharacterized membrane protein YcaP (DUF421 family)
MGISPWEKAARTAAVYLALLVLLRVAGKRQLAQVTAFDLVVLLLLSNVVQNAVIGDDLSLVGGLLGAAILVAGNYLVVRLTYRHGRLTWLFQGGRTQVARDGEVDERRLAHELMTPAELDAALRRQGIDGGLASTKAVYLEPEGTFTAEEKDTRGLAEVFEALARIERKLDAA